MTKRISTSVIQNLWHDAQRVDQNDMDVEQNYNTQTTAGIVNNFFGSGVLVNNPQQNVLFDSNNLDVIAASLLAAGKFDGTGINVDAQPSDGNLGNQIEVELIGSPIFGRLSTKVLIIGLAFDGSLIYDRMTFHTNEKQVTGQHYKTILSLLFNDFAGNNNCSRNNGGQIVVREAFAFELSRAPIAVAQDVEPNIFFRDFKVADGYVGLYHTIQNAIGPAYNADDLEINITGITPASIAPGDVVSQFGQKFLATTNNIQKVTFLMGVLANSSAPEANTFDWDSVLIVSVYPLQTQVSCPTDIIPELAIDFDPAITPLAEVSYTQAQLKDLGYTLTNVSQPVDFVFNSTKIAQAGGIIPGNYYAITFRRSGSSTNGTIYAEMGTDWVENSMYTAFNGVWVDTPEQDMWFRVYSSACKVADGIGYSSGVGIQFNKTVIDQETGATIDNIQQYFSLSNTGQGIANAGVISAIGQDTVSIQDERSGNTVFSRVAQVPNFSFTDQNGLTQLQSTSDPLIIGSAIDNNSKNNPTLFKTQSTPGLVIGDTFTVLNPDPDLLSLNLIGSKLVPNTLSANDYRIFQVTYCTDLYGDVDGSGIIDGADVARASVLIGESLSSTSTQHKIVAGTISTLELLRADVDGDGTITTTDVNLIQSYVNRTTNSFPVGSSFTHLSLKCQNSLGRNDGYFSCNDGFVRVIDGYGNSKVPASSLDPIQLVYDGYAFDPIINVDPVFSAVPFVPVNYSIRFQPFWADYLLNVSSAVRQVPTTFTYLNSVPSNLCSNVITECINKIGNTSQIDPGRNDFYVPDNLLIGDGQILRPDGTNYKIDLEIGTVILELPASAILEKSINIFNVFVANAGNGLTSSGYNAMRYSDCSFVLPQDILKNNVRFNVSIQSVNGSLTVVGSTVKDIIAVYVDQNTGLLTLSSQYNLSDPIYEDLRTKIQIIIYLKKGGFNNAASLVVPATVVAGLFT